MTKVQILRAFGALLIPSRELWAWVCVAHHASIWLRSIVVLPC